MAKAKETAKTAKKVTQRVVKVEKKTEKEIKTVAAKETKKQTDKQKHSQKYQESLAKVDRSKNYPINEAVDLAKSVSYAKFGGSLEIHINTTVKGVRGLITLPFASGKKLKILAFGKAAEESGADLIGNDDSLKEIEKGKVNFDVLVTTPEWMPKIARLARVLGPKGLMPNPKNGTVTDNLKKAVTEIQGGKTEYKSENKANVIHLAIGSLNQPSEELSANAKTLLAVVGRSKVKKATLAPTMGPGIKVDISSIQAH